MQGTLDADQTEEVQAPRSIRHPKALTRDDVKPNTAFAILDLTDQGAARVGYFIGGPQLMGEAQVVEVVIGTTPTTRRLDDMGIVPTPVQHGIPYWNPRFVTVALSDAVTVPEPL